MNDQLIDAIRTGDQKRLISLLSKWNECWLSFPLNEQKQTVLELIITSQQFACVAPVMTCFHTHYRLTYQALIHTSKRIHILHTLVRYQQWEVLSFFFDRGVNINSQDDKGNTLLHIAVAYSHNDMVDKLLRRGADLRIINARGLRADRIICHNQEKKNYLEEQRERLHQGILAKKLSVLISFYQQSPLWFELPLKHFNHLPIHEVVVCDWYEGLAYILKKSLDVVNAVSSKASYKEQQWTPLHFAAFRSCSNAVIDLLLQYGANVASKDFYGLTPDLVGIEVCINRVKNKRDALYRAVLNNRKKKVKRIIEKNVSWLHLPLFEYGQTALYYAAMANHQALLQFMLDMLQGEGITITELLNTPDHNGLSLLDYIELHKGIKKITPDLIEKMAKMLSHDFRVFIAAYRDALVLLKHSTILRRQVNTFAKVRRLLSQKPALVTIFLENEESYRSLQRCFLLQPLYAADFLCCLTDTELETHQEKIEALLPKEKNSHRLHDTVIDEVLKHTRRFMVLGDIAFLGLFQAVDRQKAMRYYQKVSPIIINDYLRAQYELAQYALSENDRKSAKRHFTHIVEQSGHHLQCTTILGLRKHALFMLDMLDQEPTPQKQVQLSSCP